MTTAENYPPLSLGLGGDGDEIDAIEEVERRFGVRLDYSDASSWRTVGDVFAALQQALSVNRVSAPDVWANFAQAICIETGVDPLRVTPDTLLIGQGRFDWRLVMIIALVVGSAVALSRHW